MDGKPGTNVESEGDRLAGLLDRLVEIRLGLRPICDDGNDVPPEVRQKVAEACEILHAVIADLVDMLKDTQPSLGDRSSQMRRDGTLN